MLEHKGHSRRMAEQRWVIDRVIETVGVDFSFPMTGVALGAAGLECSPDIMSIRARVKKYADITREFVRVAAKREAMAKRAEDEGHFITARENYFAASIFYAMARWPIHEDDNQELITCNNKKNECYDKYIEYAPHPVERVEIPFEGKSLLGYLHLPLDRPPKVPCIVSIDGMDGFREQIVTVYGDKVLKRGMAVLALDGPGQGESPIRNIRCTADNFGPAGKAAIDFLNKRPEIDTDKIGLSGISMGSFWSTQMAAYDNRFKAVAVLLSCHEPGMNSIFNKAAPTFKDRYMWMAGYDDEDEFDRFAQTLTLKGIGKKIKCPFLIIAGEDDELSPIQCSYNLYDEITAPKKIMVYQGELHAIRSMLDVQTIAADWLKDRLDGKPMKSERVYIDMLGRETSR